MDGREGEGGCFLIGKTHLFPLMGSLLYLHRNPGPRVLNCKNTTSDVTPYFHRYELGMYLGNGSFAYNPRL